MSESRRGDDLSQSICEAALERFRRTDDSLVGVLERNHIEVRDFMLLSFVCDQDGLSVEQIISALGISMHTVADCVERLIDAGLAYYSDRDDGNDGATVVVPTAAGRTIARRVLGG